MKHIKLFEGFEHTREESEDIYKKYNDIINSNNNDINITQKSMDMIMIYPFKPVLKLIGDDLNKRARTLTLELNNEKLGSTIEFSLYESNGDGFISIYKPYGLIIHDKELYDIVDLFKKAKDYLDINDNEFDNIYNVLKTYLFEGNSPSFDKVSETKVKI